MSNLDLPGDNDTLIEQWAQADREVRLQQEIKGRIEMELQRRMESTGALEIYHANWQVKLERPAPTYDLSTLMGLAELIPPEEFARAYTPEYTKVVPASINMSVAKGWIKYGDEVRATIKRAQEPPVPARIRIRRR